VYLAERFCSAECPSFIGNPFILNMLPVFAGSKESRHGAPFRSVKQLSAPIEVSQGGGAPHRVTKFFGNRINRNFRYRRSCQGWSREIESITAAVLSTSLVTLTSPETRLRPMVVRSQFISHGSLLCCLITWPRCLITWPPLRHGSVGLGNSVMLKRLVHILGAV
jgi:hypothetical protein